MQLIATKHIGALGRVVIPSEVRRTWGLQPGVEIGIYMDKGKIILQALNSTGCCFLCGETSNRLIQGKRLCEKCISAIAEAAKERM